MNRFIGRGVIALLLLIPSGAWAEECAAIDVSTLSGSTKIEVAAKPGAKDLTFGGYKLTKDGHLQADKKGLLANAHSWTYEDATKRLVHVVPIPNGDAEFTKIGACAPPDANSKLKFFLDLSQAEERTVPELADHTSCESIKVLIPDAANKLAEKALEEGKAVPVDVLETESRFVAGDTIKALKLQLVQKCPEKVKLKAVPTPRKALPPLPAGWCGEDKKGENVVCVRMGPDGSFVKKRPKRGVIRPNTGLLVYIVHEAGFNISVTWGGAQGVVRPGTQLPGIDGQGHSLPDGKAEEPGFAWATSSFAFAPRRPSSANITITTTSPADATKDGAPAASPVSTTYTVELEVEELSWGAVRFGFGSVFGDAASPVYEIRTAAGSNQPEIALASDPTVNFDVTVGFAPYIIDLIGWGGRSHTGGHNAYVAPFVGFGVVGQGAAGVEALNAIYTGVEVEFTPTFSLAAAAVWRRVTSLADGYAVGSPVEVGTSYTTTKTGVGFGLILNVSPDFLQFATPSSKSASSAPSTVSSTTEEAKK